MIEIDAKERKVLNEMFSLIIGMDWRVKFVGMVDQNGKLLAGRTRNISFSNTTDNPTDNPTDTARTLTHIDNSKINDLVEIFYKYRNMYLFYSDYLLWVIGKCIVHLEDHKNKFASHVRYHAQFGFGDPVTDVILKYIANGTTNLKGPNTVAITTHESYIPRAPSFEELQHEHNSTAQ